MTIGSRLPAYRVYFTPAMSNIRLAATDMLESWYLSSKYTTSVIPDWMIILQQLLHGNRDTYSYASRHVSASHFTAACICRVYVQNGVHLRVTNVHVLGFQLIVRLSSPRQDVITAAARKAVVADSHNLVERVHNATDEHTNQILPSSDLRVRILAAHRAQARQSHEVLVPADVALSFLQSNDHQTAY